MKQLYNVSAFYTTWNTESAVQPHIGIAYWYSKVIRLNIIFYDF